MGEYWSGFYTTDPAFKRRVHDYTEMARSIASLDSLQKFVSVTNYTKEINYIQKIQNINYHHDAITGTHFDGVGNWYDRSMLSALQTGDVVIDHIFSQAATQ